MKNIKIPLDNPAIQLSSQKAYKILEKGPWPKIIFSHGGKGKPQQKRYLADMKEGHVPITYWGKEYYENPIELGIVSWDTLQSGTTAAASNEIRYSIGAGHGFETAKPLKLFNKIIQLWCPSNGLVLDPFAGSGTTGHAVLQLNKEAGTNRSFILMEKGNLKNEDDYCRTLLQKRLQAAITGKWADQKEHESLGGGFKFFQLTKQVDSHTILQMEKQELIEAILSSNLSHKLLANNNYLIAKNKQSEGIFLIWDSGTDKRESSITEEIYYQCALERKKQDLAPIYHIYARSITYQSPTIIFHKIPDKILIDFGIDPTTDTFVNNEEE